MLRNVQRSAMLFEPANGLLMSVSITLVSSQKTNSLSLTAPPVRMDMVIAFNREPQV